MRQLFDACPCVNYLGGLDPPNKTPLRHQRVPTRQFLTGATPLCQSMGGGYEVEGGGGGYEIDCGGAMKLMGGRAMKLIAGGHEIDKGGGAMKLIGQGAMKMIGGHMKLMGGL